MKNIFRVFMRKNYPEISGELSLNDMDELGIGFDAYLREKLSDEQYSRVVPPGPMDVIMNMEHPFRTNGFHPAFILHFAEYIELKKEES